MLFCISIKEEEEEEEESRGWGAAAPHR